MKITCISDTHNSEPQLNGGDILIHCGDLTKRGSRDEIEKQLLFLSKQLTKYTSIIVTPGNHDFFAQSNPKEFKEMGEKLGLIVLINESIELMGEKIWASPATPTFHNWAFNYDQKEIREIWKKIPTDTTILITHGPPYGILDFTIFGNRAGCYELEEVVFEINPKIHAFGHIHEGAGVIKLKDTIFINCATSITEVNINDKEIDAEFLK